jgi:acyl-CoA thioester hydrolase
MISAETSIRVRYSETDQMGIVYYGNYPAYYEVGRVELFRSLGFSYKGLEESGIQMPVTQMSARYLKPAYYDEDIRIITSIKDWPGAKVTFHYDLYNQNNALLNTGATTLVFIDTAKGRPVKAPDWFLKALSQNWQVSEPNSGS